MKKSHLKNSKKEKKVTNDEEKNKAINEEENKTEEQPVSIIKTKTI
jgi:hypothetical protein